MGTRALARLNELLAGVGADLPWFFKTLIRIGDYRGLDALILILFVLGVLALVLIRDRLRANFYAALTAVLMVALGGLFYFCGLIPMMHVIENMGQ